MLHVCWVAAKEINQEKLSRPLPEEAVLHGKLLQDDGSTVVNPPPYITGAGVIVRMAPPEDD